MAYKKKLLLLPLLIFIGCKDVSELSSCSVKGETFCITVQSVSKKNSISDEVDFKIYSGEFNGSNFSIYEGNAPDISEKIDFKIKTKRFGKKRANYVRYEIENTMNFVIEQKDLEWPQYIHIWAEQTDNRSKEEFNNLVNSIELF